MEMIFVMIEKEFYASPENVKTMGRTVFKDNELYMIHSASYIEFNFVCRVLYVDVSAFMKENSRLAVFVNDKLVYNLTIDIEHGNRIIEIFDSETLHYGTAKLVKLNSAVDSSIIKINKIITDENGRIYPSEDRKYKMEFIGAEMTNGFGVEGGRESSGRYLISEENAIMAYPYLAAEEINADLQVVAYNGFGLLTGYSEDGDLIPEKAFPQYYEETAILPDGSLCGKWDFSKFQPDFIIVNLGTNDFNYCDDEEKIELFYKEYTEFLRKLRHLNPNAHIFCILGIMGDKLSEKAQYAVWDYCYDYDEAAMYFSNFQLLPDKKETIGTSGFPSRNTHIKAARELIRVMRKYLDEEKYRL